MELIRKGHSYYSNILVYDLEEKHQKVVEEARKSIGTEDAVKRMMSGIRVTVGNHLTNIYAIPYFMAFINFRHFTPKEVEDVIDFFLEGEKPLPKEILEDEEFKEDDLESLPGKIIYTFNLNLPEGRTLPKSFYDGEAVIKDASTLRLIILGAVKSLEKKGPSNSNSDKMFRILRMYKFLKEEGFIDRKTAKTLSYPDEISDRTYYRDIQVLKHFEGENLVYDHN